MSNQTRISRRTRTRRARIHNTTRTVLHAYIHTHTHTHTEYYTRTDANYGHTTRSPIHTRIHVTRRYTFTLHTDAQIGFWRAYHSYAAQSSRRVRRPRPRSCNRPPAPYSKRKSTIISVLYCNRYNCCLLFSLCRSTVDSLTRARAQLPTTDHHSSGVPCRPTMLSAVHSRIQK